LYVRKSLASVTRSFTYQVQAAVFTILAVVLATIIAGCGNNSMLITLVVRVCALQDSDLAKATEADRNMTVRDEFQTINKNIWSQAQINFLACCQDIPVVRDPFPDTSHLTSRALGSAAVSSANGVSDEMNMEAGECVAAWAAKKTVSGKGIDYGPVVVYVHDITDYLGVTTIENGRTSDLPNSNTNRCVEPRQLTSKDVTPRFSFVVEPSGFTGPPEGFHVGRSDVTLAHELGHQLLLFHGDGLDAQGNAAPPSGPGPRLFDEKCDPGEREYGDSLMGTTQYGNNASTKLTQYQIELAREAASVWPGHVGPFSSAPPS
jgi:hypothetical protein